VKDGNLSRRELLAAGGLAGAGLALGAGGGEALAGALRGRASSPLTVFEWAYYQKDFAGFKAYFKKYGTPKYISFNDDQSGLQQAATGAVPFDIAHPCIAYTQDWKDAGLIQPWDTSKIAGFKNLDPVKVKAGQVDGQQYALPWDWGFSSPMYRADKVHPKQQSWNIIFDKRYKGRISIYKEGVAVIKIGGLLNGIKDPNNMNQTQINAARDTMIKAVQSGQIRDFWDNEPKAIQDFEGGDIWVTYAWPDTFVQIKAKMKKVPLVYMRPKEGSLSWVCSFVLAKNAKNLDLAYKYADVAYSQAAFLYLLNVYATGGAGLTRANLLHKGDPSLVKPFRLASPAALRPPATWLEHHLPNRVAYLKAAQQVFSAAA
jgi:spermidine/putrescine transport system substrate-binding protein